MSTSPAPASSRWVGVGGSIADDPVRAGQDAAGVAVAGRSGPALALVFASRTRDLASVAAGVRAAAGPDAGVIGCTTSGELAGDQALSRSVVVVVLGGDGFTVQTAVGHLADGPRAAGATAAHAMDGIDRPHRVLLLLTEGIATDRTEVVRGAYGVVGAGVGLVGGAAGDDLAMAETFQLHGTSVLTGAVVAAAIGSDAPMGIGVGHGWRRRGEPLVVTEASDDRILRLDDAPALDAYIERAGAAVASPTALRDVSIVHPLGLARLGGDDVRASIGGDFEERSLFCGGVPQGALLSVMESDADALIAGAAQACDAALDGLDGHPPAGLIAFDCAARRVVIGEDAIGREVALIASRAPGVPVGGFYTYGEIARTRGSRGVHDATLVVLALA